MEYFSIDIFWFIIKNVEIELHFSSSVFSEWHYELYNRIKNLIAGYDDIPATVGRHLKDMYIEPLHHLINLSFKKGIFPDELNITRVMPMFKSGVV